MHKKNHILENYIRVIRPHHFLKNGFIWMPLLFSHKLYDLGAVLSTLNMFVVFSFAAAGVYVMNDLADVENDRQHPVKRERPIAAGQIGKKEAWIYCGLLIITSMVLSFLFLPGGILIILFIYFIVNYLYSSVFKRIAIVDVVCVAVGFELRVFAGGISANVDISHWIILMTFLLAVFLSFAKRRDDLMIMNRYENYLNGPLKYSSEFLAMSMAVMSSVLIVCYILFTVSPDVVEKHGTKQLYLTAFWVILGILRYLKITFVDEFSGSPTMILTKDTPMQIILVSWMITVYLILYIPWR